MEGMSKDLIGIIFQLLPGFIVAWILYGLTAHLKPSSFERIVQALIFTVFVRAILILVKMSAFFVGHRYYLLGTWDSDVELVWSVAIAIICGLSLSWCINNDFPLFMFREDGKAKCPGVLKWLHVPLSSIKLTGKTLHPTEWYSAFNSRPTRYVILHLSGERRLSGWPRQYPDDPKSGHFIIQEAAWLLDDGSSAPLHSIEHILIPASDVEYVEFEKELSAISESSEEIEKARRQLTDLYKKEAEDDNKCPETATQY